ncbi:MAG: RNA methyltransferase [Promethearchaeota archaeon]
MKKSEIRKQADNSISKKLKEFSNIHFFIVLIEPEGSANIGFTARSMKNFDFKNLILFNPKCDIDSDARKYSMHARKDILEKARIIRLKNHISRDRYLEILKKFLDEFNFVIGTSAKPGMFRNIKRINYYVDELDFSKINIPSKISNIALLFGRESDGLYNDELSLSDFIIKIPTSDEYSTLNLSHAVSIVLYTIFKKIREIRRGTVMPSNRSLREYLYNRINEIITGLDFKKDVDKKIIRVFKNILGRSFSSMKEINLLLSFFLRIQNKYKLIQPDLDE